MFLKNTLATLLQFPSVLEMQKRMLNLRHASYYNYCTLYSLCNAQDVARKTRESYTTTFLELHYHRVVYMNVFSLPTDPCYSS